MHKEEALRPTWRRWLLGGLLLLVIFWVGFRTEFLFDVFTRAWQQLFGALGLGGALERLQRSTSDGITKRSLLAMLTYGVLYVGLCLLLLRVVVSEVRYWWQALGFYALVMVVCGLLLLLARLTGNPPVLYRIARQLIDFLTSPMPLLVLLPLLVPAIRRSFTRTP